MDYFHIRGAKTLDEFLNLLHRANIPFDVREHLEHLIIAGSDEDVANGLDVLWEFLESLIVKLARGRTAKDREEVLTIAIEELAYQIKLGMFSDNIAVSKHAGNLLGSFRYVNGLLVNKKGR